MQCATPKGGRTPPSSRQQGTARRRQLQLLEPEVIRALAARLRLVNLLERFPERPLWAAFVFVNGFITIGVLAGVAKLFKSPFIFPSLGPSAFLFFFTPTLPTASPRHTIYGHAIGIICGWTSLWLTGLNHAGPALVEGVNLQRILAAALSLASTGALMVLFRAAHPPAGATTLIISLGIITRPIHLLFIELAIGILTIQAIVINRLAGVNYPLWARKIDPGSGNVEFCDVTSETRRSG